MFVIAPDGKLAYAGAIDRTPTVDADVGAAALLRSSLAIDRAVNEQRLEAAIAVIACYS
jgi:hypothetical protein